MWELDCEESWVPTWYFWTVVLEKTLVSPLDCTEIQPVHPKGDQSWVFIGRNDPEAETPILWPPHVKSWVIRKDWCWEGLGAGGEGDDRGWDDWMASPTRCTRVWVNSKSWWWAGRPGVLQFMRSQMVGHDWVTELNFGHSIIHCPIDNGHISMRWHCWMECECVWGDQQDVFCSWTLLTHGEDNIQRIITNNALSA